MPDQGIPLARTKTTLLASEYRCRKAFEEWYASLNIRPGAQVFETSMDRQAYHLAWHACWKYLERQVITEFIEK